MKYTNIWELLWDMRINGSNDIICADDPRCLLIGWVCQKTENEWVIRGSDLIASMRLGDSKSISIIDEHFFTVKGRSQVVQLLNNLPFLEKLNKLKAFY